MRTGRRGQKKRNQKLLDTTERYKRVSNNNSKRNSVLFIIALIVCRTATIKVASATTTTSLCLQTNISIFNCRYPYVAFIKGNAVCNPIPNFPVVNEASTAIIWSKPDLFIYSTVQTWDQILHVNLPAVVLENDGWCPCITNKLNNSADTEEDKELSQLVTYKHDFDL